MPARIGPYLVEREIGRGGMGIVWLARDDRLDRLVAIKALPQAVVRDEQRLARLRSEARIVAQLNHPNIAQIHHLLDLDDATYMILEYVAGLPLHTRIAAGLNVETSLRWMAQIARGLEAAHERGVLHRDIKPENLCVSDDGTAKILDFGIAVERPLKREIRDTQPTVLADGAMGDSEHGRMAGTPGYTSPEQCRGERVDARTDIFSFGCVLYECLTGHHAFDGRSTAELIASTLRDEPDLSRLPSHLPDGVLSLVKHCLVKRSEDRLTSMRDARITLEDALGQRRETPTSQGVRQTTPTNLSHPRDRFIGRTRELDELTRRLDEARLVTLTGAGGCGKTRLASELARRMLHHYDGGVWIIELAAIVDAKHVNAAVATAMGIRDTAGKNTVDRIVESISDARVLLVLDNCEHVLEAAAAVVGMLLDRTPNTRVIVTSREPLGIRGEQAWRVPSLALPEDDDPMRSRDGSRSRITPIPTPSESSRATPHAHATVESLVTCESTALFADRARAVRPGFEITRDNAASIARICRRLDGIPLAIELAAARTAVLAPEQIESRLSDRFKLLRAGRGKTERHQTLRAAIDWSFRLLTPDEQRALRLLAVFAGGFGLEAAAMVIGGEDADEFEILDLLTSLSNKSMISTDDSSATVRYFLLESVRQYAMEELDRAGESMFALDRHLAYFEGVAAKARRELLASNQEQWLTTLDIDRDNFSFAIEHACRNHAERAQRICGDIQRFWLARGYWRLGLDACASAIAASADATSARADALNAAGTLSTSLGDLSRAARYYDASLAIRRQLDLHGDIAASLNNLGNLALRQGSLDLARERYEEALTLNRSVDNPVQQASNLCNLGLVAMDQGDFQKARTLLLEAADIDRRLGNEGAHAITLGNLALAVMRLGDVNQARGLHEQALEISRRMGDRGLQATSLEYLSNIALHHGDVPEAKAMCAQALGIRMELGDGISIAVALDETAKIAAAAADHALALRIAATADGLYKREGVARDPYSESELRRYLDKARATLAITALADTIIHGAESEQLVVIDAMTWLGGHVLAD